MSFTKGRCVFGGVIPRPGNPTSHVRVTQQMLLGRFPAPPDNLTSLVRVNGPSLSGVSQVYASSELNSA